MIVLIAVALSIGLHWVVLQSVAWVGMFMDYSAEYSFTTSIGKTFDGKNKCELCRLIEDGAQADESSDYTFKVSKLNGINNGSTTVVAAPSVLSVALLACEPCHPWMAAPPTPPPPIA